jgi:hypothetical protein
MNGILTLLHSETDKVPTTAVIVLDRPRIVRGMAPERRLPAMIPTI